MAEQRTASTTALPAAIGSAALLYAISVFTRFRPAPVQWAHELVPIIVPVVAAVVCFRIAPRVRGRTTWRLLGAGCVSWAIGDVTYTVLDAIGYSPAGDLTWADAGYLMLVPLWAAALILHPARAGHGLEQVGTSLDAAAVIVGAGGLAWAFVLSPIAAGAENVPGAIVNMAYPIGDLALMTAFFALVVRSGVHLRSADAFIGLGVVLFAVADLVYARLALTDSYETGSPVDLLFEGGFVAVAFAATRELRRDPSKEFDQRAAGPLSGVLGIVSIAVVGIIGIVTAHRTALSAAVIMGVLLSTRQTVLLIDRRRLNESHARAMHAAQQANTAKTEFLSHMSHELGNPLTAILGYSQIIEKESDQEEMRGMAQRVVGAAEHLNDIIREALDISRIEQGRLGLSLEPVLLSRLATECVDLIRPMAETAGIKPEIRPGLDHDCYVLADQQRLKQVVLNLLSNAVKYNKRGGKVTLAWETGYDRVRVTVTDTGPGIPRNAMGRLFTPFERLGSAGGVSGTGLGLTVSKHLVEAMRGTIGVDSEVGRGSTFWVDLPRGMQPQASPAGAAWDGSISGTLLHIEDNVANLTLVEQLLRGLPITIVSTVDGAKGVELARKRRPDAILLDRHLPDGDAEDVLAGLRDDPETARIPVIVLSADSSDGLKRLLDAGARACLTKPIDVERLMGLLGQVLRGAATPAPSEELPRARPTRSA